MDPITDPKEIEIYELAENKFTIILLKNFGELQEHTERQLNKIWKIIHEQNEKFNKEE